MKWTKTFIIVIFLNITIGISIAYYYTFFLPTQVKQEQEHKLQLECKKLGEQIDKKINESTALLGAMQRNPEYFYNKKLRTCFYCGGFKGYEVIIDAYTNEEIASSFFDLERDLNNELLLRERGRFDKHKAKLFEKE